MSDNILFKSFVYIIYTVALLNTPTSILLYLSYLIINESIDNNRILNPSVERSSCLISSIG